MVTLYGKRPLRTYTNSVFDHAGSFLQEWIVHSCNYVITTKGIHRIFIAFDLLHAIQAAASVKMLFLRSGEAFPHPSFYPSVTVPSKYLNTGKQTIMPLRL